MIFRSLSALSHARAVESELGTIKRVRARFWPWLAPFFRCEHLKPSHLFHDCSEERLLSSHVERFRGGLVCKAHRLVYRSTLGSRVIKKKKQKEVDLEDDSACQAHRRVPVLNLCPAFMVYDLGLKV